MIEIYRIKYNTKWTDWTQICSTDYIDALEFDECKVSSEGGIILLDYREWFDGWGCNKGSKIGCKITPVMI